MAIIVTGAEGQLGAELCRQLGDEAVGVVRGDFDLVDEASVRRYITSMTPKAVINCAAYTRVDRAEIEPEACRRVNADAVAYLAEACRAVNAPLVQLSTDYVFGSDVGRSIPYSEVDSTGPLSVYGYTKLAGERNASRWERHIIIRSSGLYGLPTLSRQMRNFPATMLRLAEERDVLFVVDDQRCTPTYVCDLAKAIIFLLSSDLYGLYHVTNLGDTTWYDFAEEMFRRVGKQVRLEGIVTSQHEALAPRPAYSVLDCTKYHGLGGPPMRHWANALGEYLDLCGLRS